ncbi:PTS sugar transporter subunit IIA [Streptococcus halichoeri]|uniref:PTS sugar transporter subunit IIA n=1 Tax=Streptococcus halichoeri TaxID=254785 RepID=UPI001358CEE9|nr:PTS sugar transporter subunit IIA [Streptococcus halichoeri]
MSADVLLTQASTQEELFDQVADHLSKHHFVTDQYRQALKEREQLFPTGLRIDFKDGSKVQYAAIPHTETAYCLVDRVVYVKNSHVITCKHMINPAEECYVNDFFFIINSRNDGQTTILSQLMSFFMTKGNLEKLAALGEDQDALKKYLLTKGVLSHD